ncbi:MAG: hypothetical protein AAGI38_24225, partial [Bacteroidota bacterium]
MIQFLVRSGIVLCLFMGIHASLMAQATLRADSTQILIGDHLGFILEVTQPANGKVQWPLWEESLGELELINYGPIDSSNSKLTQQLTVTAFDSGQFQVPAIELLVLTNENSDSSYLRTNPISIDVFTVPIDTTQG